MRAATALLACTLLVGQEAPANRVPVLGIFPEPLPDGENTLALEASSHFLRPDMERSPDGRTLARMDAEEWLLRADLARDCGPLRLCGRVRLAHRSGGCTDQAFLSWHRLLGTPQGGREDAPRDRLALLLERDGVRVGELSRPGLHVMDLDLAALLPFGDATRGGHAGLGVQLPTGRRRDFSGSGGLDATAGAAGWARFGPWRLHGQAELALLGLPRRSPYRAVLARRRMPRAWAGLGWQGAGPGPLAGLGVDLTLAWCESPYRTGIPRLDRSALQQHWTFTSRAWPAWRLVLSEEAGSYLAPDLGLALVRRF